MHPIVINIKYIYMKNPPFLHTFTTLHNNINPERGIKWIAVSQQGKRCRKCINQTSGCYLPPNSCIPSRAKTTMNRKSRKRRLMMDFMELIRDTTKFLKEAQYLIGPKQSKSKSKHALFSFTD